MKKCATLIFVLVLNISLVSCASPSLSTMDSNLSTNQQALNVYLNDFDDIIGPMFEEATGYKINVIQGSGSEILSRIEAEQGNPRWDVIWVDMIASVHGLGMRGLLYEDYTPDHAHTLNDTYKALIPEQEWYFPTSAHAAAVITYNTNELTVDEAPHSWTQFSDSVYYKAIGVADPTIAAPAYSFVNSFFEQYGMSKGKTMINSWFVNGLNIFPKNPNVAMALISGQIKVAALQESNAYTLLSQKQPISIIWPTEGAPASVRVAAISKHTKQLNMAKAFINFLLDPATQQRIIDNSDEAYHEPSALGVTQKDDRDSQAKLIFTDALWSYKHESEIKQWFTDYSIK